MYCNSSIECHTIDMNLVCSNETSKCECRDDMRWSKENIECQVYIAVDCSIFDYDWRDFSLSDLLLLLQSIASNSLRTIGTINNMA